MALDLFNLLFLFQLCYSHVAAAAAAVVESHSQAFIQTDKHLTYIVGDLVEIKPGESYSELNIHEENILPNGVRLDPPMLEFGEHPVGMPHLQQVSVHNADTKTSLHLLSISGSTAHFHCSFFQDKMVPPGGNTTFDVVFLARQVGPVDNTLYIHTTQGSFKYQVFGVGIPNPYRLRPYLGAKVPLNSSFSSLIEMHNPHSSTLQVVGMFSSAGDLHLELPTGDREATTTLWEIPPYETKPVMRANFIGRVETNHTAFIRIKTNHEQAQGVLILPVEVEVTSAPGIYSPVEMIDFGILRTLDEPQTVQLNLLNTGSRPVHITGVSLSPNNDAVSVEFRPIKLQPDILRTVTVAHITFRATKALNPRQWSGRIVVKYKHSQNKLTIPYQVNVLHGSLVYNTNNTHFYSGSFVKNLTRMLAFTNTFNFSIVIYNVTLPPAVHQYFSIKNFSRPVIIRPQETLVPFLLHFHPNKTSLHFTTQIIIQTNASSFNVPIIVYSGLLKVIHHRPEKFKGQLDFGTMGVREQRSITFTVQNNNPVNIVIGEFSCSMNRSILQLLGIEKGNGTTLTKLHNMSDIDTDPLILKPYHFAVFSVNVTAAPYEGVFSGEVLIVTQFQDLYIPVSLRTAEGSLNAIPENLIFDKVYPGKIPYKILQIHSTFQDYMKVKQVMFRPADIRFYYQPPSDGQVSLEPQKFNRIGRIYFDAKRGCKEDCYVGLPTYTPAGHQWLLGLGLDREVANTDQYLYTHLQQKWDRVARVDQSTANVTIELDTNQVRGFLFSAQAHLHWPALIRKCKIKFPLTQIGNMSMSDFIVENPGDVPVLIQILALPVYPNPQTIVDLMSHRLASDLSDYIETDDREIFILPDLEQSYSTPTSDIHRYYKHIESTLGIKPHKETITALLNPGEKLKFHVGFRPKDDLSRTSLIIIRNNLTIIDCLVVQGQGGQGEMRFSNRKAGSQAPLPFEMTEKHLKNCDKKKQGKNSLPHFTVKRMFTMRNTGELPFYVHGFSINSSPCEGYGFKVLDCIGFELPPNGSQKIDIAFTPDFTMSRIRRVLTIFTSLGPPMNYTLQATVPPYMLAKCAAALPRPSWEMGLYYAFLCIIIVLTVCVFIAAYFEAKRICVADSLKRKLKVLNGTQPFEKGKAFDLKNITGLSSIPSKTSLSPTSSSSSSSTSSSSSSLYSSSSSSLPASSLPSPSSDSRCSTRSVAERSDHNADHSHHRTNKRWTFKTVIYLFKKLSSVFYISSSATATTAAISTANATPSGSNPTNTTNAAMANSNATSTTTTTTTTNKKSNILNKANVPEKDSRDLHVQNNLKASSYEEKNSSSSHHHHHHNHSQHHHHQDDVTERSSSSNNNNSLTNTSTTVHRNKKTRAAKRYHNDLNSNSTDTNDRRILSERNTDSAQQKKVNYDKNFTSLSATSSGSQDDYKSSHNNCSSNTSRRVSSEDQRNNDDQHSTNIKTDAVCNVSNFTAKGKNKKKKNKTDNKEPTTKSRFSIAADEKDETSSTTTESSTGDPEEKACSRESSLSSTPQIEPVRSKTKKSKTVEKHSPIIEDIGCADDDFELTTKSKAHKKVKVNPKEAYGGNILKPSTLELPYNLENKKSLEKKEHFPLEQQMSCKVKKLTKQTKGKAKTDGASSRPADNDNTGKNKELWDAPHPSPSGDLSDLASQTENFALQHSRPYSSSPIQASHNILCSTELSPPPPPPSAPLSTSSSVGSRSSSYSSVVSNNNLDTSSNAALLTATNPIAARKPPTKPCTNTPMATAAAPTAPENWTDFNLFADHGLSATFSTRPCPQLPFSSSAETPSNPFDQPYGSFPPLQNRRMSPSPLAIDNQLPSPTPPFSAPPCPMPTSTDMNLFMDNTPRRPRRPEEKVTSAGDNWLYPSAPSPPISESRWVFNSSIVYTPPLWTTSPIQTSMFNPGTVYDPLAVAHIWEPNHTSSPPSTAPGSKGWPFPNQPNDN